MNQEQADCVVIGAGVVGLAVAREMALSGRDVLVIDEAADIGTGISSRNSEVIHAGIYYPENSLKARLCVRGKHLLYEYALARGIPHKKCGKLIVATTDEQGAVLGDIQARAAANGVEDLELLSAAQALQREPALKCQGALHSPSTGIIDTHSFMLSLQADIENNGGTFAFLSRAVRAEPQGGKIALFVENAGEETCLLAKTIINAAGLGAVSFAREVMGLGSAKVPPMHYAKGNYFGFAGRSPFTHLIYPVPEKDGLGTHLTLDMSGRARFGPDVEWVEEIDYKVSTARAQAFYGSIRQYWPDLPDEALYPDYAGIRPKIHAPDMPGADFVIQGAQDHGIVGLVNLFGIESPGITASLAIAEYVHTTLGDQM